MRIIKPEVHIEKQDWEDMLRRIERKGRVCYKSEERIMNDSADKFVKSLIHWGHMSVLEHVSVSVKFIVDRGVSHELVRHRIGAYSQESTRYCNYSQGKFGNEITVIEPFYFTEDNNKWTAWKLSCEYAERAYHELLEMGSSPQESRSVLPNSLKTELWVTYDLREWRHFFDQRADKAAHPQMRQVVIPLLLTFKQLMPVVFDGISYDTKFPTDHYAEVKII